MRIACVDNMNHIMFSLARFLRDRGVDADVLLSNDTPAHFHPSCDAFDDEYRAWTRQLGWGGARSFFRVASRTVRQDLARYDAVIGGGFLPAFCEKIGRRLDIFVPRGDDLVKYPSGVGRGRWSTWLPGAYLSCAQRLGIRHARWIFCPDFYRPYRTALERLGVEYVRVPGPPVYYPQYDRVTEPALRRRLVEADRFDAIRERSRLLLHSHTRHYWRRSERIGYRTGKGNNLLIEAFARYVAESGRADARLVLFEYGDDVGASKALCAGLGIGGQIAWLPQMPRRELVYGAAQCDIGADQFPTEDRDGGYGGATIELMSVARPVLGRLCYTPEQFRRRVGFEMPPLVNVHSVAELTAAIARLAESPAEARTVGVAGRRWVEQHYGEGIVERYIAVLRGEQDIAALGGRHAARGTPA